MTEDKIGDILEVFLITYNRKKNLEQTLKSIYAPISPIRNLHITILDNKSTDGSSELIDSYIKAFPNSKHVIHNRNIGGNGNIARCYELASKEYFWILCDDDEINFDHWDKVEAELIKDEADAIVVANYLSPSKNVAQLIAQLSFVPAAIYKTSNMTDTVMQNVEWQISTMFPQLALACKLINDNKKIEIMDDWCVKMVVHPKTSSYQRGMDSDKHPLQAIPWALGFLESIQLIKDEKKRNSIIQNLEFENGERIMFPDEFLHANEIQGNNKFCNETLYFALVPACIKYMYSYDMYKAKCGTVLPLTEQNYINSEIHYEEIKRSKAFRLGNALLWLPKKILHRK
jgi:glycosyltransferase involved in cell wall biosynthesis